MERLAGTTTFVKEVYEHLAAAVVREALKRKAASSCAALLR